MPTEDPLRILIAEDDRAAREALVRALELEGYSVDAVADGAQALESIEAERPDLLLLDVMMPDVDGLAVCRRLRAHGSDLPILILTARTETSDRVVGLDAGADDYLPKPYELNELLARIRALLRRTIGGAGETLSVADLEIDLAGRSAKRGDRTIKLSKTEFDLLELLARNKGIVLERETIHDRIWGYDFGPDSKNLAVYIGYLRRKIEEDGEPTLLHTVRGVGYVVREP
ncbi:MAG: response regulator transcription factor [Actinomycetes bacterium]